MLTLTNVPLVTLQLVGCVPMNERAAAAGLWPPDPLCLAAYGAVEQLRLSICHMLPASGELFSGLAVMTQLASQMAMPIPSAVHAVYVFALRLLRTMSNAHTLHNLGAPKCAVVQRLVLQLVACVRHISCSR